MSVIKCRESSSLDKGRQSRRWWTCRHRTSYRAATAILFFFSPHGALHRYRKYRRGEVCEVQREGKRQLVKTTCELRNISDSDLWTFGSRNDRRCSPRQRKIESGRGRNVSFLDCNGFRNKLPELSRVARRRNRLSKPEAGSCTKVVLE